jgi:hypothetical protein
MLNKFHYVGKLTLANRIDKMNYGIFNNSTSNISFDSITDILDTIYHSSSPFLKISIRVLDDSLLIRHKGKLNISPDQYGVCDYCVDEFALGLELFKLTGNEIEIHIEHLEEKEIKKKVLEATS